MFAVESSFSLKNFVFGFGNIEKSNVVIGTYDKGKRVFIIDYDGKSTKEVKEAYEKGKMKLPYIHIKGVGYESYQDITEKEYIRDLGFFVDYFNYSNSDGRVDGKIIVDDGDSVFLMIGLSDGLRWNTGRLYESCKVTLSYDDYFDVIEVNIKPFENVEVVSYRDVLGGDLDEDTTVTDQKVDKEELNLEESILEKESELEEVPEEGEVGEVEGEGKPIFADPDFGFSGLEDEEKGKDGFYSEDFDEDFDEGHDEDTADDFPDEFEEGSFDDFNEETFEDSEDEVVYEKKADFNFKEDVFDKDFPEGFEEEGIEEVEATKSDDKELVTPDETKKEKRKGVKEGTLSDDFSVDDDGEIDFSSFDSLFSDEF